MAPERWRELLEAAAAEFAAHGYEQASLNRIIRACRMSKSSFYYYVESKEKLFDIVVDEIAGALARALDVPSPEEFAAGDFWDHVEQLLDRLVTLSEREPAFTDVGRMFHLPGAPVGKDSALTRSVAAAQDWLERTLAAARSAGAVRADLPLSLQLQVAAAIIRAFDEWTLRNRDQLSPDELGQLVHAQLDALKRLLATAE
ncbi:hypothetical protein PA7_30620 [Pseudonocardia asaccharolytica DSM 44247 = NBRC 16224]|uniref:HTH tetR-type domain-containing protein n=2 Tax=Pseudonocardia asaccharolytica TaxID=54010 RepID=A0A511D369_9PSEU|nr:hypothetical protein PA7_30620 [Pseudonocardia asaccharolytica DSM 44247 = NBRC 16224]